LKFKTSRILPIILGGTYGIYCNLIKKTPKDDTMQPVGVCNIRILTNYVQNISHTLDHYKRVLHLLRRSSCWEKKILVKRNKFKGECREEKKNIKHNQIKPNQTKPNQTKPNKKKLMNMEFALNFETVKVRVTYNQSIG
jgi:hypothetical protein